MSDVVRTNLDSFSKDIEEVLPMDSGDVVEGVYKDLVFRVKYQPTAVEETCYRGEFIITVLSSREDIDAGNGGTVFYLERHEKPDGYDFSSSLRSLFSRASVIASRLIADDDLRECPYCGFLVSDKNKVEKRIPLISRDPVEKSVPINGSDPCVGVSSLLPPRVEVYPHDMSENLVFGADELESCDSLVRARGYPEWAYNSSVDTNLNHQLRCLAEKHPHIFDDDIDVETVKRVLDEFDYSSSSDRIVDRRKFTIKESSTHD